jgi:Calcineurin-like phosphoesterase
MGFSFRRGPLRLDSARKEVRPIIDCSRRRTLQVVSMMGLISFSLASSVFGQPSAKRDWNTAPAIVRVAHAPVIFALGDVHGDYGRLVDILLAGGLIRERPDKPNQVRWSGDNAILVCTGDMIDKGDHSLHVIALFQSLQADAAKADGRVIVTMGNHEAEFLADPDNDEKSEQFVAELKAKGITPRQLADGTDSLHAGVFLRSLPFAARI